MSYEYRGMEYLKKKLTLKKARVLTRYKYYEMKNRVQNISGVIPENLKNFENVLGWSAKAVDSIADRLIFRGFDNDNYEIENIYDMNNRDVLFDSAILSASISACSFIYISTDENDFPKLQVIDGANATGVIDDRTGMLHEGYAVLERDKNNKPELEAYFVPGQTRFYREGKLEQVIDYETEYPLLVPVIYRPDAIRPFGHSRISRACMSIQQSALRTVMRAEITAEFYSFPQKYVLGLDQDADPLDTWRATISSFLRFDKDVDGGHPTLGQFQQQSMAPHTEQLKMFAGLFAGETGLTLDDLGFPSANPSSSEAIKASHENLRLAARKAQRTFGVGFLNAGYLAACVRDHNEYTRSQLYKTHVKWEPVFEPDASQLSGIGDAAQKIQMAFPDYFDAEKLRDLTGI